MQNDVSTALNDFVRDHPGLFKSKNISFYKRALGEYGEMASCRTNFFEDNSRTDTITLSSSDAIVILRGRQAHFNLEKELTNAFRNIRNGEELTFSQEYSVESVWHEMMHAGANGWRKEGYKDVRLVIPMETINQFCARKSYGTLLSALGGTQRWSDEIMKYGFGYTDSVSNFCRLIEKVGISQDEAFDYFKGKIRSVNYEDLRGYIVKMLYKKKKAPIELYEKLVDALENDAEEFVEIMGEL